jgi:biopolymer transport protein ExbB/TolQ
MPSVPSSSLMQSALDLPVLRAEWVMWLLLAISVVSIGIMVERAWFFSQRRVDIAQLRDEFASALARRDTEGALKLFTGDALEHRVVLFGLRSHEAGPDSVEDLLWGATHKERERYDERLGLLATIASTAPYIGLFGTVLGIIHAFRDLSHNLQDASGAAMAGIAEALITTALGLAVAIPALVAFNAYKRRVKVATNNAQLLCRMMLAHLKAID